MLYVEQHFVGALTEVGDEVCICLQLGDKFLRRLAGKHIGLCFPHTNNDVLVGIRFALKKEGSPKTLLLAGSG